MKDPLNSSIGAQTEDALGLVVDRVDMARVGPGEQPFHDEGAPGTRPLRGPDDGYGFGAEKHVQLFICRHRILPFPQQDASTDKVSDAS